MSPLLSPVTETMGVYDDIDADVLRNYQEFALVNVIYLALREGSTSEQSARMTAMDSASKNACKDDTHTHVLVPVINGATGLVVEMLEKNIELNY